MTCRSIRPADAHAYRDFHTYDYSHSHLDRDSDRYAHSDGDSDCDPKPDSGTYPNGYTRPNSNSDSHGSAN